jgi:hypothetical protein
LLGVGEAREGWSERLLERATLRVAPPAALVADSGSVEERSLPYPLSIACIDANDDLGLSDLSVSPERLLGGETLCKERSGARLANLDNLVEALREVDDERSVFGYFGHAEEGELGADLGSHIPLAGDTRLTAEDVFVGREGEGDLIPFPERILLSACGSAGSTGAGSGEWLGLTAGMLCAGARELLATAWPIWNLPIAKSWMWLCSRLSSGGRTSRPSCVEYSWTAWRVGGPPIRISDASSSMETRRSHSRWSGLPINMSAFLPGWCPDAPRKPAIEGRSWWGTEWGTKSHVVQPISAKPDLAETA